MQEPLPLPQDRLTRLEHVLARLAILEHRGRAPAPADTALANWFRIAQGDINVASVEWAQLLGTRLRLRDFGMTALAHRSTRFMDWLRPQLDRADSLYRASTTPTPGTAAAWVGVAPELWWYRRLPADDSLTANYAPPRPLGDVTHLLNHAELDDLAGWLAIDEPVTVRPGDDLSGANLTAADLRSADLKGANLTGAKLVGAQVDGASFVGAVLDGADLRLVRAEDIDFTGASMANTRLDALKLAESSLRGAKLTGASLRRTYLHRVDASNAQFDSADITRMLATECLWTDAHVEAAIGITPRLAREVKAQNA